MALRYLLDTNVLSEAMRPVPDFDVMRHINEAGDTIATASPVWHELQFGVLRLPAGKRRRAIQTIIDALSSAIVVLPYDADAATWHARERARLTHLGRPPPYVDGQIAAIAVVHRLALVTRNVRDFSGFADLCVESWFST